MAAADEVRFERARRKRELVFCFSKTVADDRSAPLAGVTESYAVDHEDDVLKNEKIREGEQFK